MYTKQMLKEIKKSDQDEKMIILQQNQVMIDKFWHKLSIRVYHMSAPYTANQGITYVQNIYIPIIAPLADLWHACQTEETC